MADVTLIKGDATERWPLEDNTLDSIVTDPPYGIAFMGKSWDDKGGPAAYQEWSASWAREAFRCLKPGGFLLAFGATRMAHRMTCGFEDAGFDILDTIEWLYLSGLPKAQDIGKMFDKAGGKLPSEQAKELQQAREAAGLARADLAERIGCTLSSIRDWEEGRARTKGGPLEWMVPSPEYRQRLREALGYTNDCRMVEGLDIDRRGDGTVLGVGHSGKRYGGAGTDLAKQWDGWKTPSLKPAHEPIVVARKPLVGTYCENLERWGVGAINVDGCRVAGTVTSFPKVRNDASSNRAQCGAYNGQMDVVGAHDGGRFPANVLMSHGPDCTEGACMDGCPVKVLDQQSGILTSGARSHKAGDPIASNWRSTEGRADPQRRTKDTNCEANEGGASKVFAKFFYEEDDFAPFFYSPKSGKAERNAGCESLPMQTADPYAEHRGRRMPEGSERIDGKPASEGHNFHPTVKPRKLISYLQRLVTPPGGLTGSPFLGSGTDAVAAIREGFAFWGMNLPDRPGEEYWPIIDARVAHALKAEGEPQKPTEPTAQTAPPAETGQVRFSFEGTINP